MEIVHELGLVFYWWFILFSLGIIVLPLTQLLFRGLFSSGYLFSKVVALVLFSWPVFLLAHLRILPFTQTSILIFLGLMGVGLLFFFKKRPFLDRKMIRQIFWQEIGFLLALLLWSYVRSLKPDISCLEKFMNFGFMRVLINSRFLPPIDMWFAGETINYYYYGHFLAAFLTKLSGIVPIITYNLMIATLFALTTSQVFSLVSSLVSKISKNKRTVIVAGLLGALLIGFASNLHTPYYVLKDGIQSYWYPNATRYIGYNPPTDDKTIHEFPAYSFVVADLHGHVSSLPLVILFIGLNLSLILEGKSNFWLKVAFLGFLLGIIYMINAWDLPIYLLFFGICLLINLLASVKKLKTFSQFISKLPIIIKPIMVVIGLFLLASLPFNLNFQPMTQGIGIVKSQTPFSQLLVLWGAFGFWAISFLFVFKFIPSRKPTDFFVLGLITTALILIGLPEIIYVKDIYIDTFHRANTMFKLTFQAYLMLTVASVYIIVRTYQSLGWLLKRLFLFICFVLIGSLLIYPFFSIPGFYGKPRLVKTQTLSGLGFLAQRYPEDYQAIIWIEENLVQTAVVLEAAGDSYTDFGRVSVFTGRPTIQGWFVHQWLWRGNYEEPTRRALHVEQIYQSANIDVAQSLLQKYAVDYLFFGQLEREKYPQATLERLSLLGEPVFRAGRTVVFRINSSL